MPNDWNEYFWKEWRNIDEQCARRTKFGEIEYKHIDFAKSKKNLMTRNFLQEIKEELLDQIVYTKCEIIKIEQMQKMLEPVE